MQKGLELFLIFALDIFVFIRVGFGVGDFAGGFAGSGCCCGI
jgi:hypothetical protein